VTYLIALNVEFSVLIYIRVIARDIGEETDDDQGDSQSHHHKSTQDNVNNQIVQNIEK
jgi:hypothetical protein